jgi:hypothetical protein
VVFPAGVADADSAGVLFRPLPPTRVFDTRSGVGGVPAGARWPGSTLQVKVTGRNGVPSTSVSVVALNVTAVDP